MRRQKPGIPRPDPLRFSAPRADAGSDHGQQRTNRGMPVERLRRIQRRKARSRAATLAIFVMIIMLATIVLIIAVMKQAKPSPEFIFIQEGELAHTVSAKGLIIRDETTFAANVNGLLKPLTTEGSRAAVGQKLALIIPADKESLLLDLQKCENDIADLQTTLMNEGKGSGAQAIFDESASSLSSIVNLIRSDVSRGTLSNMSGYSASISVILEQRTTKLTDVDFNDSVLNTLELQRDNLEKSLGLDAGTLICQKPGIISFRLDGLEQLLTPAVAETITVDSYRQYIGQATAQTAASATVTKDQQIMRISSNLNQYLVFLLPTIDSDQFTKGSTITISLAEEDLEIADCTVERSVAVGADAFVIFKTDRQVERLSGQRSINAELTLSTTTGLKVPVSSLIDYDPEQKQASLMIVTGGYTKTCLVEVVDMDRTDAIIKAISSEIIQPGVSTVLVVNPSSIKAGEYIGN